METGHSYYIGLMSGTSADAIDAALIDLHDPPGFRLVATHSLPMPDALRSEIERIVTSATADLESVAALDMTLGHHFAEAARMLCDLAGVACSEVRAIGSHGQTVRHRPRQHPPYTIQIGNPAVIAEQSGITTVADFRSRDIAAGGEGAPLVPAFHQWLFGDAGEHRAVLNLGGIANLTLLSPEGAVGGFDTGPGNTLLDQWIATHQHGVRYDADGRWAASGRVQPWLLEKLLHDPYFTRPPPKSTGREHFNLAWLRDALGDKDVRPEDVQATLVELTAESIARALDAWAPATYRVYVCGGGRKNTALMASLTRAWPGHWGVTEDLGLDGAWVEASAFAWLAARTLARQPGNVPAVTGARRPVVLGAVYWGS
ncbi:MAG: anhydro-N-acetylmuramic acid kinase [Acidiferrobacteraceae bacterium]